MTIKSSGPLSISDIVAEFGGPTPESLAAYYAGGVNVPASVAGIPTAGQISLDQFYGKTKPAASGVAPNQTLTELNFVGNLSSADAGYGFGFWPDGSIARVDANGAVAIGQWWLGGPPPAGTYWRFMLGNNNPNIYEIVNNRQDFRALSTTVWTPWKNIDATQTWVEMYPHNGFGLVINAWNFDGTPSNQAIAQMALTNGGSPIFQATVNIGFSSIS